jgi:thioesterase domain-containing protein
MSEQMIPRLHQMGVTFVELRPGSVRAELPFEGNANHFGSVYAGVIYSLAEVLGGAIHLSSFNASTHYPLIRGTTIKYLKPGKGPLSASASLDEATIARVSAEAGSDRKASFELHAEVIDENGVLIATTVGDYQIRPYGT